MGLVVVLTTCERPRESAHALQSLLFQTRRPEAIVVVENSDGCRRVIENETWVALVNWAAEVGVDVAVTASRRLGMVGARVLGEQIATRWKPGRPVMMADDDQVYPPRLVEVYERGLEKYDVVGTTVASTRVQGKAGGVWEAVEALQREGWYFGGTLAYRPELAGMWERVKTEFTENLLEDLLWQWLAFKKWRRWMPYAEGPGPVLHLDVFSEAKYGGTLAELYLKLVCGEAFPQGPVRRV